MSIVGTRVFNDNIDLIPLGTNAHQVDFECNGVLYTSMRQNFGTDYSRRLWYGDLIVYDSNSGWIDTIYKTINITKQPTDETLIDWIKSTTTTLSKVRKLTRLYLGDVVAKGTTRQLRKLTTEKPQEDSIIGTWLLNDRLNFSMISEISEMGRAINFNVNFSTAVSINGYSEFVKLTLGHSATVNEEVGGEYNLAYYYRVDSGYEVYSHYSAIYESEYWVNYTHRIITITGGDDINNETLKSFILTNGIRADESALGTWYFDSSPNYSSFSLSYKLAFRFGSNETVYTRVQKLNTFKEGYLYVDVANNESVEQVKIYDRDSGWTSQTYRTINVLFVPEGDLWGYWLKANATKIA